MTVKKAFAFAGRKVLKLFLLIAAVEVITFALMEASPIDPVTAYVGASTSIGAEQRELIAEKWGLNKPPFERFGSWFRNILHGDWGDSMIYRRPVMQVGTSLRSPCSVQRSRAPSFCKRSSCKRSSNHFRRCVRGS